MNETDSCPYGPRMKHEWTDLYFGAGQAKGNKKRALVTFYCKWCVEIRIRSYDQSRFRMSEETEDATY